MIPTNKLRFVEREIDEEIHVNIDSRTVYTQLKKVRVLQQWWVDPPDELMTHFGEWRDVPLET